MSFGELYATIDSACPWQAGGGCGLEANHHTVPGMNSGSTDQRQDRRRKDTSKTHHNVTETRTLAALKSDLPERRVHICFHKWRHTLLSQKRSAKKKRNSPPFEVG